MSIAKSTAELQRLLAESNTRTVGKLNTTRLKHSFALTFFESNSCKTSSPVDIRHQVYYCVTMIKYQRSECLLSDLKKAAYDEVDGAFLSDYKTVRNVADTSAAFIENQSSVYSRPRFADDSINISNFRRCLCEKTDSRFQVFEWRLDFNHDLLLGTIRNSLFEGDAERMDLVVEELKVFLDHLRRFFYAWKQAEDAEGREISVEEVSCFQPLVQLFLEEVVKYVRPDKITVEAAQTIVLQGKLSIGPSKDDCKLKDITGYTDILVFETGTVGSNTDLVNTKFLVEIKSPCGTMYHSAAGQPKDQFLCQSETLGQMTGKKRTLGALTDIFVIALGCRKTSADGESCHHYITPRTVDARQYVLQILLLFCPEEVIDGLLPEQSGAIPIPLTEDEINETNDVFEELNLTSEQPCANATAAAERTLGRSDPTIEDDKENYHHSRKALLTWNNRRKGFAYLSEEELNRQQRGQQRVDPMQRLFL